jgi:predicted NBD/HSP70 family sugar kinase
MVQKVMADLPNQAAVKGLNVAIPGIVDLSGDVLRAPPLNWRKVPFREQLAKAVGGLPVHKMINDANAFAVAQLRRPDLIDTQDAVFLLMDDGIGGCILSGGRLLEGISGLAAEIGHMPIGTKGHCNLTGIHGAFENYVSRPAILAHYASLGEQATTLTEFLAALDAGNSTAQNVLSVWTQDFAQGLAILTALLNPERIIVGGRVAEMARRTERDLLNTLRSQLLEETPPPVLELTGPCGEGPAVGAAMVLHHQHFAQFGPLGSGRPELLGTNFTG